MKILPASAEDAADIAAIWNPVIKDTTITFNSVEKTELDIVALINERQAAGYEFLVAKQDSTLLGFASYGQFRGGVGYAHTKEHTVFLADNAKGKGVGRALLNALESHARKKNIHSLIACVSDSNSTAIEFHKALGYKQVGQIPQSGRKFGQWLGMVFLQKFL